MRGLLARSLKWVVTTYGEVTLLARVKLKVASGVRVEVKLLVADVIGLPERQTDHFLTVLLQDAGG